MTYRTSLMMCVVAVLALAWAAPAQAMLINYDIYGSTPSGAGVVGSAGDVWNQPDTGGSGWKATKSWNVANLVDSTGTATGASLSVTQGGSGNNDGAVVSNNHYPTANGKPFDASLGDGGGPSATELFAFTVSGLSTSNPYDVYVFFGYDATWPTFPATVNGGATQSASYSSRSTDPTQGQDYLLFTGVTATGGQIAIEYPKRDSNAGMSGFQIQEVPEPATLALLGLGGVATLLGRKRRR